MNARKIIEAEAETPKGVFRALRRKIDQCLILCPIQGREEDFWSDDDHDFKVYDALQIVIADEAKLHAGTPPVCKTTKPGIYTIPDQYQLEATETLGEMGIQVIGAFRQR